VIHLTDMSSVTGTSSLSENININITSVIN